MSTTPQSLTFTRVVPACEPSWTPYIHLTRDVFPLGEQTILNIDIQDIDAQTPADMFTRYNFAPDGLCHPSGFTYRFHWTSDNGYLAGNSGAPAGKPAWGFIAPEEGRYLLSVEVFDETGATKTQSCWVWCGEPHSFEDEQVLSRRPASQGPVVIDVSHVSMMFNIASEQFNSLKEYAIAALRRELHFKPFYALKDISFQVRKGEAFGLVGTNGSGKSTMLKIIAGVLEASKGTCNVHGTIAPLIELGAGFDLELTCAENIYLNGALLGYKKEFIDEHFDEIIDFAELRDFMDMPLKNYSSGMVARIAFAIATITEPDILIVDETLSVGDFLFQKKCEKRIQQLVESQNVTVLLVSHSIDLVERICNRACWIEHGSLVKIGSSQEVCAAYKNLER